MIYRVEGSFPTTVVHADGFYTESQSGTISFYRRGFPMENDVRYTHYFTGVSRVTAQEEDRDD